VKIREIRGRIDFGEQLPFFGHD